MVDGRSAQVTSKQSRHIPPGANGNDALPILLTMDKPLAQTKLDSSTDDAAKAAEEAKSERGAEEVKEVRTRISVKMDSPNLTTRSPKLCAFRSSPNQNVEVLASTFWSNSYTTIVDRLLRAMRRVQHLTRVNPLPYSNLNGYLGWVHDYTLCLVQLHFSYRA